MSAGGGQPARSAAYRQELFAGLSGLHGGSGSPARHPAPLVIALHGGGYSSRYFDVPGLSFLERASLAGVPVLAPDRPGYGASQPLPPGQATIRGNADALRTAIKAAWSGYAGSAPGVVLVGHSIGGAIAMTIASEACDWPLLGVAVSGFGLRSPRRIHDAWASLPDTPFIDSPPAMKNQAVFGPPGSFDERMQAASHVADAPVPRTELIDIVTGWEKDVQDTIGRVRVPVQYRQAELDNLWIVDEAEVARFAAACSASPYVDAKMVPKTGHCMDFHHVGAGLHFQQLGFALQLAAVAASP